MKFKLETVFCFPGNCAPFMIVEVTPLFDDDFVIRPIEKDSSKNTHL